MLIRFVLSLFRVKNYIYGNIEGFKIAARKDLNSGLVEVRYRERDEKIFHYEAWAPVKEEYQNKFIQCL